MRTTLKLDDDILEAARELAKAQHKTLGEMVSELARKGMSPRQAAPKFRNGIPQLPVRPGAKPVTLERVNALRDDLP